jgi:hypothetical protein
MADALKVAIPEKGEVLIEWGDRKEVVSLSNEVARKLDLALPGKLPGESGLLALLEKSVREYAVETCRTVIKAAFQSSTIPFTDSDMNDLEQELGFEELSYRTVALVRPVMWGKKRFLGWLDDMRKLREQIEVEAVKTSIPELSPGTSGVESPSESSTSAP